MNETSDLGFKTVFRNHFASTQIWRRGNGDRKGGGELAHTTPFSSNVHEADSVRSFTVEVR